MISRRLVGQIEENASKLATEVIEGVLESGHAPSYNDHLPREEYYRVVLDLYSHLGTWLHSRSWHKLDFEYESKGRDRFARDMPIAEVVYSLSQTKARLIDFIRGSIEGDASERDLEVELIVAISEFFDRAMYHTVHGYEDARRVQAEHGGESNGPDAPKLKEDPEAPGRTRELSISRSGEVGESPG